jgi:putative RecB family exonuclease
MEQLDFESFAETSPAPEAVIKPQGSSSPMKPYFNKPLSHSSISMYETCPQRFKFRYIDRIPEKPKSFFSFGKSVHAGLEFLFMNLSGPLPGLEELIDFYKKGWIREGYETPSLERDYYLEGERILRGFYEKHKGDLRKAMFVEYKFNIEIEGIPVTGFVDRIDKTESGRIHIIDYKTGRPFDKNRVREDPQISLYQFALTELLGLEVECVTLYHLNSLTPMTLPAHPPSLIENVPRRVRSAAGGIAAGRFEPTPDERGHCRFCDYKPICPAFAPLAPAQGNSVFRGDASPVSAAAVEEAVDRYAELSQQIRLLEKQLEALRPLIEDYCREKGYRRLAGKKYELICQRQETWKFDPEAVRAILGPAGLWEEVLRYDSRGVDRLIKEGMIPVDIKEKLRKIGELVEIFKITPKTSGDS